MMNVVALCLVVTSLATAGVWSPTPSKKQNDGGNNLIVKEGHRVVVVEYDQEGQPVTKVSISPEDSSLHNLSTDQLSSAVESAKEKLKEASSVLPNLGQGLSQPDGRGNGDWRSPRELICDAYGKCKHKIADAIGRTKEAVSEKAHDVAEKTKEAVHEAHDAVEKTKGQVHDVFEKTEAAVHDVFEKTEAAAHEAVEKKKKAAHGVEEAAEEAYEKAKETVRDKAHDIEGHAKEKVEKARKVVRDATDLGKTIVTDVAKNASGFFGSVRNQAWERVSKLSRIVSSEALNPVSGVVYLMGFSTAYGTSVWVTFILSYVLARALPRQQFGMVQSKIYPVYFRTMAWGIGTALLGYLLSHRGRAVTSTAEIFQVYNLLASLVLVFVNMLYLEPRATKVMFERMRVEKEEGRGREELPAEQQPSAAEPAAPSTIEAETPEQEAARNRIMSLNGRLKKLNTFSSFLNILSLMSLSWHVYYLSQRLHLTY